MRTRPVVAPLLVVLLLTTPGFGQSVRTEGHGVTWGAGPAEVIRAYPDANCFAERTELSDWRCVLLDKTVDGIGVDVTIYGYSLGTTLGVVMVVLGFESVDANALLEGFVARYGRWSRVVERDFVTKADKRFPSPIWLWHLPDLEIRVEQDRERLGHGQATVMWREGLHEFQERERTWRLRYGDDADGVWR